MMMIMIMIKEFFHQFQVLATLAVQPLLQR